MEKKHLLTTILFLLLFLLIIIVLQCFAVNKLLELCKEHSTLINVLNERCAALEVRPRIFVWPWWPSAK